MTAKEMFEKLGYHKFIVTNIHKDKVIKYFKREDEMEWHIDFENQCHFVRCYAIDNEEKEKEKTPMGIEVEELQAINKQIEELGWNNAKDQS